MGAVRDEIKAQPLQHSGFQVQQRVWLLLQALAHLLCTNVGFLHLPPCPSTLKVTCVGLQHKGPPPLTFLDLSVYYQQLLDSKQSHSWHTYPRTSCPVKQELQGSRGAPGLTFPAR